MSNKNLILNTEKLFCAIGHAVVRFQQVELWLSEELALLLRMREQDDQYLVSAAMSFSQKVDLLVEIFPRKLEEYPKLFKSKINILDVRKALYAAEAYRNRVVHSFYAVECDTNNSQWMRIKGSLRGRTGFSLNSAEANIQIFEECNAALAIIREWILQEPEALCSATSILDRHLKRIS